MHVRRFVFTRHALVRSEEWGFDADMMAAFEGGFHCVSERNPSCRLCIFKVQTQYFTIVYRTIGSDVLVITVHHSNPKEIKMAEGRWKP
ncbi:MAG: hypothetical protein V1847_02525 [Candidatus Diapherotrites archaeon]